MKKVNIKKYTLTWLLIGIIAAIVSIICAILIVRINNDIETITNVRVQDSIMGEYRAYKAYGIGVLAFSSIVLTISIAICFLGFKSWSYNATL
ncbi:hypothetical protein [Mycoplasma simbae]|uniref:hypothetical protein n=1 Tax=Mycoplasma simbae TaxID=36744 RepID=UPI000497E67D|nr:hypothetical protein [Mycoplasma simbae]